MDPAADGCGADEADTDEPAGLFWFDTDADPLTGIRRLTGMIPPASSSSFSSMRLSLVCDGIGIEDLFARPDRSTEDIDRTRRMEESKIKCEVV